MCPKKQTKILLSWLGVGNTERVLDWESGGLASRPGSSADQLCGLGQVDRRLWASCFSFVTWVNQLLAYPHRISVRLKKENLSERALEITMQCKDARGDGPCTEPDPNRQHLLVPVLVVNRGMKDFICFLLPY